MRVISGSARGRRLDSLKGENTRPTTDRVRESAFNILSDKVLGSDVVDLFAGSGAMGIEALSRGARQAVFVENNHSALVVVKKNLAATGFLQNSQVIKGDALSFLKKTNDKFDIIFVDPPYLLGFYEPVLDLIKSKCILRSNGIIMLERPSNTPWGGAEGYNVVTDRKYGSTSITILNTN